MISASDETVVGLLEFTGIVMCHSRFPKIGLKQSPASCKARSQTQAFHLKQNSSRRRIPRTGPSSVPKR